ncbi:transferase family protein [Colletotrichum truncatum]|uniref:Transferase family protein n=1 Tax=Colletotrichum truncatum TaxID=5467 RepID=A0ACC3ZLQ5_COLTU|nr:transferase family protein [Colletotrichum truncatum]KAF6786937.1 transferase family protein [Colletotrichum truncatum]
MANAKAEDTPSHYHVQAARRIFPKTPALEATVSKLSIIDATVARFTPTAAIWLYDKSEAVQLPHAELFKILELALSETLDSYRHFAGQIQWATEDIVKNHVVPRHVGRPVVAHGAESDPGVELLIVDYDVNLHDVVPSRADRTNSLKEWNATDFRQSDFLPDTKIALSSLSAVQGLPSMAVQLTAFKCGGIGVSAMISHPLADALCLMSFMQLWAARSRDLLGRSSSSVTKGVLEPIFDPTLLDQVAGLCPGSPPDASKLEKARSLPMHRFDWWAEDAPGFPAGVKPTTRVTMPSPEELENVTLSPSTPPPWLTWDMSAPVEHVQIRFSAAELTRMADAAQETLPDEIKTYRISRTDAVLAHIWILINRARNLQGAQDKVYLDVTLGLRSRVNPPLPETFTGSPLLLGYVEKSVEEAASPQLGPIAGAIRKMMSHFTPDAVAAYIHDAAYEVSPQRLWQAFLGTHHTLVTSWVRTKAYELDFFGTQELARYVQAVMPKVDGLVHIMDIEETGEFDISVCIEREAMHRLLQDPLLRKYDGTTRD